MRFIPIKIFFYWLITRITFRYPRVIKHNGRKYIIKKWEGGTFYYTTYWWKGAGFDDALDLIRAWVDFSEKRGKHEQALGRYKNDEEWEIGFISKSKITLERFNGLKVRKDKIPAGKYAVLQGIGHPENIFAYWFWLKRKLIRDHFTVDSPTFEIYDKNTFNEKFPAVKRKGEIRYKIREAA
jgi:hypothetical protein